jgi:hypothetical protein
MNGKSIAGEEERKKKKNNDKHLFYSLLYIFYFHSFRTFSLSFYSDSDTDGDVCVVNQSEWAEENEGAYVL